MNLEAADRFVFEALDVGMKKTVMRLADDDLQSHRPCMFEWMGWYGAGEYRDLELALDLLGNMDAPL